MFYLSNATGVERLYCSVLLLKSCSVFPLKQKRLVPKQLQILILHKVTDYPSGRLLTKVSDTLFRISGQFQEHLWLHGICLALKAK